MSSLRKLEEWQRLKTASQNGDLLAVQDHPELFLHIGFTFGNEQFDAKLSLSAYRKIESEQQPSVFLGYGTLLAPAISLLVEWDKLPFMNFYFEAALVVGKPDFELP